MNKPIPINKTADGGVNTLITSTYLPDQEAVIALYERNSKAYGHFWDYEVVVLKPQKADHTFPDGSILKAGTWLYPTANQFGSKAWSIPDANTATDLFTALVTSGENRKWGSVARMALNRSRLHEGVTSTPFRGSTHQTRTPIA